MHKHLRRWWPVSDRAVWPRRVVVLPPAFDDDLRLPQRVEDLAVEEFVPEAGVERLDIAVLSGAAWGDVGGLGTDGLDPVLHGLRNELRTIVRTNMARHAAQDEQVGGKREQIAAAVYAA